jgi:chromosome segregation protein SMC
MYLKAIEIKGFKSFVEKTVINLPKGMISIVGPNGSGKSNILDAIRWVLGEQSVKSLRGEKMEDVIFAGTLTRSQLGYCEVTLLIDNEDKKIEIDYTELAIKRKAYRNGESQFFINDKRCRLKDIKELLLDTGIGKEGYSIISQGRIDEIISSNGYQKRALLEEACGITKYRYKKEEGEKNLSNATENLERINDIYQEIENQIKPLKIQKEKAQKYIEYKKELKVQEINKILQTNEQYEKELEEITKDRESIQLQIQKNEKILKELTESISKFTDEQEFIIRKKENIYTEKNSVNESINQNKLEISIKKESIKSLLKNNDLLKEQLLQDDTQISIIKEKLSSMCINKDTINKNIKLMQEDIKQAQAIKNTEEEKIQAINIEIRKNEQKSRTLQTDISRLETRMEFVDKNIKSFEQKFEEYEQKQNEYEKNIEKINSMLEEKEDIIRRKYIQISDIENKISKNKEKIEECQQENSKVFNDINESNLVLKDITTKTYMLENFENDMQGFSKGIKAILKNKNLQGIENVVANVITVKKGYEKAIEQLLFGRLENIIIQKSHQTKQAIDYLKKEQLGRATFLPMDVIKSSNLNYNDKGVKAIDVVEYDKKYENIISNLLGKMVIVDDMDTALKISSKYNNGFRLSTKDGEIFNVGGSITGGSTGYSKDIFTRRSTITENKEKIELLKGKIEQLKKTMQEISNRQDKIKQENIQDELLLEENKNELNDIQKEKASILSRLENININKNQLLEEKQSVQYSNDEAKKSYENDSLNLKILQTDFETINQIFAKHGDELKQKTEKLEEIISTLKEKELQYNLVKQELSTINVQIQDLQESMQSNTNKTQNSKNKIEYNNNQIQKYEDIIQNLEKVNFTQEEKIKELSDRLNEIMLAEKKIIQESKIAKDQKDKLTNEHNDIVTQKIKIENEESKIIYKIELLSQNLYENYEISLEEAQEYKDEDVKVSITTIKKLKDDISSLGNVNLDSIEEYAKVEQRYLLYKSQKEDLEESIAKINAIIKSLEKSMVKDFRENFDIINKNFNDIFKILFGGGSGKLTLEDENDVLNTNIEISVQPPGKKLKGLSMLSGGEKALSAIALLFAIIARKPVPFCILDEIDAPLDDANIFRYITYLSTLVDTTQFVTITHRRTTMEASDYIYGVTMQEKGVSNIISLQLEDAKYYMEE